MHVRVLLLGGTAEARALAATLTERRVELISSLAGRVTNPAMPVGQTRIGGFGGASGLETFLVDESISAIVDATHPFAESITSNACLAASRSGLPLLVLRRPGWIEQPGDQWTRVPDITTAARVVAATAPATIFLTTGRRDLGAFSDDDDHHYLVRTVDPPTGAVPPKMTLLLDRGPYVVDAERALMTNHKVRTLVTKDSGGPLTEAKLSAARELGVPVVMVDRPALPADVRTVATVPAALDWVIQLSAG